MASDVLQRRSYEVHQRIKEFTEKSLLFFEQQEEDLLPCGEGCLCSLHEDIKEAGRFLDEVQAVAKQAMEEGNREILESCMGTCDLLGAYVAFLKKQTAATPPVMH